MIATSVDVKCWNVGMDGVLQDVGKVVRLEGKVVDVLYV